MMKLTCKDLNSSTNCTFEATGDKASEVEDKMMTHAKMNHADDIKGMSDADVKSMMEAKMHS